MFCCSLMGKYWAYWERFPIVSMQGCWLDTSVQPQEEICRTFNISEHTDKHIARPVFQGWQNCFFGNHVGKDLRANVRLH